MDISFHNKEHERFVPSVSYHPGVILSEKLKEMRMGIKEFAIRTSKPEKTIFAVMNGKSSVTPDMALAFENVTKIPAHFWLDKQRAYDEYVARKNGNSNLRLNMNGHVHFLLPQW